MIPLKRMDGKEFVLNCDLIKTLEAVPDTLVTLVSGEKILVRESISQVVSSVADYRKACGVHQKDSSAWI